MILVKFEDNYADEFDTEGFRIMTQEELDEFLAYARENFIQSAATVATPYRYHYGEGKPDLVWEDRDVECYFGSNEHWQWSSYEYFMSSLKFQSLSMKEATSIVNTIGGEYGMFPSGMGEY